jgi:hypothetical protein
MALPPGVVHLLRRLRRWEFWPAWLFYLPLAPWIAWLALRHRGLTVPTAANPAFPDGGFVGESKHEILSRLPAEWVVPGALLRGPEEVRLAQAREAMDRLGIRFPVVLKPDAGQRGAGVRIARSIDDMGRYLALRPGPILLQAYHPGPHEAGVFYYRLPGEARGRIFSITDKHFPALSGDGRRSIEELIRADDRLCMQAGVFLRRHATAAARVLAPGERMPLVMAGNHCQGAMFRDGAYLHTPALEARIDAIARQIDGFYFGRFDVRYRDVEAFRAGCDLSIVELNGMTSESTNVYDPSWSLLRAYGVLARQWSICFRIGSANRRRGHRPTPLGRLWRTARAYYRDRPADLASD